MKSSDFRSNEELWFYYWLLEAQEVGLVLSWAYESTDFMITPKQTRPHYEKLKTKIRQTEKHLLHKHSYKPDFDFIIDRDHPLAKRVADAILISYDGMFWTDIKGEYNPHGGDRVFSINQKLVYSKYHIYINKVVPRNFFMETWAPESIVYGKGKKKIRLAKWFRCKLLSDLL